MIVRKYPPHKFIGGGGVCVLEQVEHDEACVGIRREPFDGRMTCVEADLTDGDVAQRPRGEPDPPVMIHLRAEARRVTLEVITHHGCVDRVEPGSKGWLMKLPFKFSE